MDAATLSPSPTCVQRKPCWTWAPAAAWTRCSRRAGVGPSGTVYGLDPDERTAAENRIGCAASTLTAEEYRHELRAAGFTGITITATSEAGEGLHTAIVQAAKPTG